ncbi:sigma-70 family RNA polymerase sigma factor [Roseomonas sp. E05]|uniref:sigma-70 family RNA polymerase sigma factor n=1 Tax=Roseomonas sp. E05 TaxID=3046310 RepID=UPI0024BBDA51|nr:sigma-70 family RNA polymerase sigma factor [Roseomonas sp. E05]MDJ0390944.1 sigma-70 family RNA polymerase sigma factor [Roseomonas sp. E05]
MTDITDDDLRDLLPQLRRFALHLTREAASADDLVQACLERALSRWSSRRPDGSLRAWMFTILYRQFIAEQRRARRFSRLLHLFGGSDRLEPSPEDTALARSGLEAVDSLPVDQRALLLLVSVEGLSYKEAAEALDVPIGTVMSRLSRARTALHRAVEGDISPPSLRAVT